MLPTWWMIAWKFSKPCIEEKHEYLSGLGRKGGGHCYLVSALKKKGTPAAFCVVCLLSPMVVVKGNESESHIPA